VGFVVRFGGAAYDFLALQGHSVLDQSTDDWVGVHRCGALGRSGQSFCLPTDSAHAKADCYFCEIMRTRLCNPASLPACRVRRVP
jgi:hypothetical protein